MSKGQLKKSLENIEQVIHEACKFLQQLNLPSITNDNGRQDVAANSRDEIATSAPPPKVFGRDDDRDKIISMLHEKECDGQQNTKTDLPYSVAGIHGIAGSGKSTLAQFVCDREKEDKQDKKDGHFDIILWVHVSQKFDLDAIYRKLLEEATGSHCPKFSNRNTLQEKLEGKLHGKRIFLVLDDVWYDSRDGRHQEKLQQILSPLRFGKTGSKVLVTSRTKDALLAVGAAEERCIPISDLDHETFYAMFMHYALREDADHREILETIGADIAKKLKRSPLAARTVGAQLRRKPDVQFWRRTKDRDLLNETMGALWWSYQHLDDQVRRCFAYCSIYPRRRRLKRDELIQLWMAEGFIKTSNAEEELDAVGQDYFDELLSASFLQPGGRIIEHGYEPVDYFTVHDLLRDLAEEAARGDCFRIEKGFTGEIPPEVRHLFVESCDRKMFTEKIFELQNLRTLIFDDSPQSDMKEVVASFMGERGEFLESMFRRLRKLRVLILSISKSDGAIELPACIGQLKHLRYFCFKSHGVGEIILPDSIAKLYHIQHLDVNSDSSPFLSNVQNMSHLINLRRVSTREDFPNIGRLRWLQMLRRFSVRNKPGYELRQLKDLNKLEGYLKITGLDNVQSKEEAIEASLAHKERVTDLVLDWDIPRCSTPEVEAEVLEGLCPSKYLERLQIMDYRGSTYPNWMVGKQNGGPEYLRKLWFINCRRLEPAPELFKVFVHLRRFWLWASNWSALPASMEQLEFLQSLDIHRCPNILSLPALPQSLEKFSLTNCNEAFMTSCRTIGDSNWKKIQHIPDKYIRRV